MINKIIGLSGLAGSGKDLFCEMLIEELQKAGLPARRFALADALKEDVKPWCIEKYGIDPTNCSREDKAKIREFLVFHGNFRRQQSNGTYWTSLLTKYMDACGDIYKIVTDIRYMVFEKDEVQWIRDTMKGILVHIKQYTNENGKDIFLTPPNEHEAINDPKLEAVADYKIVWKKEIGDKEQVKTKLRSYVQSLMR